MSVNRVILIGRLTRDPEHRTTTTGKAVTTFGIAVRKRFKPQDPNERDADFFNIKVWGQSADYAKNYLTKGRLVAVDGRIETRKFTDKDGNNREVVEIVAENVNALDSPRDEQGGGGGGYGGGGQASGGGSGYSGGGRAPAPAEDEYDPFADE